MVKNLPKYVTKERIKSHFGGRGTITDIKLVKTKDGNSRRFCYIGFKTDEEGLEAVRYFHNTFMDTCRLSCEVAKSIGDETIDRPWSKYSEGSSLFKKQNETQPENNIEEESGKKMNKKQKEFLKDLEEDDPEFKEFLKVMENRGKRVWGNDDAAMDNGIVGNTIIEGTKDDEYEDLPQVLNHDDKSVDSVDDQKPKEEKKIALDSSISDLEYLRLLKEKSSEEVVTETVKVHPGRLAILQEAGVLGNDVENCYKDYSTEPAKSEGADKVQKVEEIVAPTYLEPPPPDLIAETGRIMVRNLAYSCTYEDLQSHFQRFGLIAEIHLPMDKITKESKGYAFILYVLPESAVKAFIELDKSIFQGRIIEIVAAKEKPKTKDELEEAQTFKELREKQKKKNASNDFNWNSLFMNVIRF
jgi:multiple RNA-binding domain-containing protein 1